ncbi:MAG: ImmA/IrrE family metallo-endopeptidase [Proteobacteria bacterium]|nr:ImmA/IrrE family metallo-endopeptidase [Pseudomonadota bacterium]
MLDDTKVPWLDASKIEEFALAWRKIEGNSNASRFKIVEFLYETLPNLLVGKALEIITYDDLGEDSPAFVRFLNQRKHGYQLVELHIENWVLENAKLDDEEARKIIAHEIGHIILHDVSAQKFSPGSEKNVRFLPNEESGEWQAKRFADAFLVPLHVAASFDNPEELAEYCSVDIDCAKRRLISVRAEAIEKRNSSGYSCIKCGDYNLRTFGMSNFCMNCQAHFISF